MQSLLEQAEDPASTAWGVSSSLTSYIRILPVTEVTGDFHQRYLVLLAKKIALFLLATNDFRTDTPALIVQTAISKTHDLMRNLLEHATSIVNANQEWRREVDAIIAPLRVRFRAFDRFAEGINMARKNRMGGARVIPMPRPQPVAADRHAVAA